MIELRKWYELNRFRRFEWGRWDCVLAAADWSLEATGIDLAEDIRGKYFSAWGATQFRGRLRLSLADAITQRLGDPIDQLSARDGDIALTQYHSRNVVAIVHGEHLIAPGENGLKLLSRVSRNSNLKIISAWTLPTIITS